MNALEVRGLGVAYGRHRAVHDVTFTVEPGRTVGLVGESGSGKSTVARTCVGLESSAAGDVILDGESVVDLAGKERKRFARRLQLVFQDAGSALNPRMTVRELLEEPMIVHGLGDTVSRRASCEELLSRVQLPLDSARRYPAEFSGGQKQRIAIARALAVKPKYLILDEVTSALDVSVQGVVLNLLMDLQEELGLGYLFISHNLAVVRIMSDDVVVMRHGEVVEHRSAPELFAAPEHAYTKELLRAVPRVYPRAERDGGR